MPTILRTLLNPAALVIWAIVITSIVNWQLAARTSIWSDETITMLTLTGNAQPDWDKARKPDGNPFVGHAKPVDIYRQLHLTDVHPPFYFWVASLWRQLFGTSLEAIRHLSLISIAACVWMVFCIAHRLSIGYPAVPAVLFACSGAALGYGYTARPYALATLFVLLTLDASLRRRASSGLWAALTLWTHYFAVLCVAPTLVYYYFVGRKSSDRRWMYASATIFLIGSVAILPLLRIHLGARPLQYIKPMTIAAKASANLRGSFITIVPMFSLAFLRWFLLLALGGLMVVGIVRSLRKAGDLLGPLVIWTSFTASFFLLEVATGKSIPRAVVPYYMAIGTPFLALIIGLGMRGGLVRSALTCIGLLLPFAGFLPHVSIVPRYFEFRAAARELVSRCGQMNIGSCIVVAGAGSGRGNPGSVYYEIAGKVPVLVAEADDTVESIAKQIEAYRNVFLVPSKEPQTIALEEALAKDRGDLSSDAYIQVK